MKLRRFIVAAILVVCISFLGYWAFFFIKPAVDGVGKKSAESIPVRESVDQYYYNDSGIKGSDEYARFELKRTREEVNYDFCMVLRKSLPKGETIENYAIKIFDEWEIGKDFGGKGVLFLFIEDIQELKIEVGYELEDVYPDTYCTSFQKEVKTYMAGNFYGDVFGSLMSSMLRRKKGDAFTLYSDKSLVRGGMSQRFLSGGAGVTTRDFYSDIRERVDAAMDYEHEEVVKKYPVGKTPLDSLTSFLNALHDGIDYPFLPMVTKGSQLMKLEYPHPANMLKRFWNEYSQSQPFHIMEDGDLAAAKFSKSGGCIYLRKAQNGDWLVDIPKTWSYQAYHTSSNRQWLIVKNQPWMFAHRDIDAARAEYSPPELRSVEEDPYERIHQLEKNVKENPHDAEAYFKLGEYLFFECYWIRAAIAKLEQGLELSPSNIEYRFMVIGMRMKFPMWDKIPHHYESILKVKPKYYRAWVDYHHFSKSYFGDKKLTRDIKNRSPYHK